MTQKQSKEIKVIRIWRKTGFKSMSRRYSTAIESPFPVKNNGLTEIMTVSLKFWFSAFNVETSEILVILICCLLFTHELTGEREI